MGSSRLLVCALSLLFPVLAGAVCEEEAVAYRHAEMQRTANADDELAVSMARAAGVKMNMCREIAERANDQPDGCWTVGDIAKMSNSFPPNQQYQASLYFNRQKQDCAEHAQQRAKTAIEDAANHRKATEAAKAVAEAAKKVSDADHTTPHLYVPNKVPDQEPPPAPLTTEQQDAGDGKNAPPGGPTSGPKDDPVATQQRIDATAAQKLNDHLQNGGAADPQAADYFHGVAADRHAAGGDSPLFVPAARLAFHAGSDAHAAEAAGWALEGSPRNAGALEVRSAARLHMGDLDGARADALILSALEPDNRMGQTVRHYAEAMGSQPNAKPPDAATLMQLFQNRSAGSLAGGNNPRPAAGLNEGANSAGLIGAERAGRASYANMSPSNKMAAEAEGQSKLGDLKTALKTATLAIEADKSNPEAYAVRAGIWNKSQRYLLAQQDANSALRIDPGHTKALGARAFAYNMTGHPVEAQQDALKVLAADPRNAMGYLDLAMSQEAQGQAKDAQQSYQKAAQLDPTMKVFYDEFLSKHPELLGGGATPILTQAMRSMPPVLQSPAAIGGLGLLLGALAVTGVFLIRRSSNSSEEPDDEPAPPQTRPATAPSQGAATIAVSSARTVPAKATISGNGAPTILAGATGPAGTTLPAGATVRSTAAAVGPNGGMLIAKNYEIRKELGKGGMGVVYEAFDISLGRKVAIKEMRPEIAQSTRDKDRFMSEARTVAKFQHPNIVSIYSILEENGRAYLVFEHVEGNSLDKILDQRRRLSPEIASPLFQGIAAALDYSHARKVIHRDLKPANVMISDEGVVKVMDFGIAHEAKQTVSRLTNAEAFGTMAYMPPEQELGQASKESDVFAFAVLAYEALVGKMPFPGPNYLAQKKGKTFAPPSQADPALPKSLDAVFDKALEPEPAKRQHSAGEFAVALAACFPAS